eukprot:444079-Rhodomonas_salina.1
MAHVGYGIAVKGESTSKPTTRETAFVAGQSQSLSAWAGDPTRPSHKDYEPDGDGVIIPLSLLSSMRLLTYMCRNQVESESEFEPEVMVPQVKPRYLPTARPRRYLPMRALGDVRERLSPTLSKCQPTQRGSQDMLLPAEVPVELDCLVEVAKPLSSYASAMRCPVLTKTALVPAAVPHSAVLTSHCRRPRYHHPKGSIPTQSL